MGAVILLTAVTNTHNNSDEDTADDSEDAPLETGSGQPGLLCDWSV